MQIRRYCRRSALLLILTLFGGSVLAGCHGDPPKPPGYHEGPQKGRGRPSQG